MTYFESQLSFILEDEFDDLINDGPVSNDNDSFDDIVDAESAAIQLATNFNRHNVAPLLKLNPRYKNLIILLVDSNGRSYTNNITNSQYHIREFVKENGHIQRIDRWLARMTKEMDIGQVIDEYLITMQGSNHHTYTVVWSPLTRKWDISYE